ncbi:hypothetical protein D3C80_2126950 [compost metagenome]
MQGKALTHRLFRIVPVRQQLARHREEAFPFRRQRHTPGGTQQQLPPQHLFQSANGETQRRLRNIQPFARLGEVKSVSYR